MVADRKLERAGVDDPEIRRDARIEEEERGVRERIALEASLCRENTLGIGSSVDRARCRRSKLSAVLAIEDHSPDRVRVRGALNSVHHNVADCDLSLEGLAARLCRDDSRKPIEVIRGINLIGGEKPLPRRDPNKARIRAPSP